MVRMALGLLALSLVCVPAEARPATQGAQAATELSAQAQRPRLRVSPDRRPLLYRDCSFKLVQEWRPSGPVIVPWQRCWWVRG